MEAGGKTSETGHVGASFHNPEMDRSDAHVDFANIALYIPAIQLLATLLAAASCLLLCGWVLQGDGCAVRSASLCFLVCAIGLWRKVKMHYARGADNVFDALRPAAIVWLTSIVAEHLVGACAQPGAGTGVPVEAHYSFPKNAIFHLCMLAMMISGLVRAWSPDSENDYPFGVSAIALLMIALVPPPVHPTDRGPLCATESGYEVGERYLRTVMFAVTYTCFVYAAPPLRHGAGDVMLCFCRAAASSIWTLGCIPHLLIVAPVQCAVIIWLRMNTSTQHSAACSIAHDSAVSDDGSESGNQCHFEAQRASMEQDPLLKPPHGAWLCNGKGTANGSFSGNFNGNGHSRNLHLRDEDQGSDYLHVTRDLGKAQLGEATKLAVNTMRPGQGVGAASVARFNLTCQRDLTNTSAVADAQARSISMAEVARRLAAEDE